MKKENKKFQEEEESKTLWEEIYDYWYARKYIQCFELLQPQLEYFDEYNKELSKVKNRLNQLISPENTFQ